MHLMLGLIDNFVASILATEDEVLGEKGDICTRGDYVVKGREATRVGLAAQLRVMGALF